jgi:hypothetical protein
VSSCNFVHIHSLYRVYLLSYLACACFPCSYLRETSVRQQLVASRFLLVFHSLLAQSILTHSTDTAGRFAWVDTMDMQDTCPARLQWYSLAHDERVCCNSRPRHCGPMQTAASSLTPPGRLNMRCTTHARTHGTRVDVCHAAVACVYCWFRFELLSHLRRCNALRCDVLRRPALSHAVSSASTSVSACLSSLTPTVLYCWTSLPSPLSRPPDLDHRTD